MIDILNSVEASSEDTNPASSGDNADQDGGIDLGDFMGEVGDIQITLLQTTENEGDNSGDINKVDTTNRCEALKEVMSLNYV